MINLDSIIDPSVVQKSTAEKIEEELKIDILTGKRPSGQRIVEQKLCSRYGISRTPIREVLRHVEAEGLIEAIPNRGAFVKGFSTREIDDFFLLKAPLETQCVRWAIERITPEEMDMLEQIFEFMEFYTMSGDLEKMIRINHGFDAALYQACHNQELEKTLTRYNFYLHYANLKAHYPANYLAVVLEEHRAIFRAFQNRDPDAGAEATEIHMLRTMIRRV